MGTATRKKIHPRIQKARQETPAQFTSAVQAEVDKAIKTGVDAVDVWAALGDMADQALDKLRTQHGDDSVPSLAEMFGNDSIDD